MTDEQKPPSAKEVSAFHKYDDLDKGNSAHHHSVGQGAGQVAAGKHFHDGEDSPKLLEGTIFTGIVGTYNAVTFRQVLAALAQLGASDTTS